MAQQGQLHGEAQPVGGARRPATRSSSDRVKVYCRATASGSTGTPKNSRRSSPESNGRRAMKSSPSSRKCRSGLWTPQV
jgi:hypothetical protein